MTVTITLDTGVLDDRGATVLDRITEPHSLAVVSVSVRERQATEHLEGKSTILETGVWDQSRWGEMVWGGGDRYHSDVLAIITNGASPNDNQVRDAMAFADHLRHGRDLFVTTDAKAFVNHGRRDRLEALGPTTIRTLVELGEILDRGDPLLPARP
jgi:hypothetical protein